MINDTCVTCDPNTVYDDMAQTCTCKVKYFGDMNKCTKCHGSCRTCSARGATKCLSCGNNRAWLKNGRCKLKRNLKATDVLADVQAQN